ncbi:germ cell nuclear acidic protein isoform X2 [Vespa velutina]|uniref:germ cell nuclear acidic protein isoform X2 n=1 Tax=Vespa velutina TaxID=202808 RepID=UPI001FB2ADCC|nr:germ cell nuclear acidic protein isoform X2 [Vespa velutina]
MNDFSDDSFSPSVDKQNYKKVIYQILPKVSNRMDKTTKDILKVTIIGSQDFSLKLTDNSVIEDTQDIFPDNNERSTNENDAIVISDSSFDHSLDYFDKKTIISPVVSKGTYKSIIRSKNYALEISNDSDEDENFTEKWRNVSVRNKDFNKFSNCIKITISRDKNSFYTSDDSFKKNSTPSSEHNKNTNASKNEHVSSTPINKEGNDEKSNKQIQNISEKKENIYTSLSKLNLLNKLTNNNSNSSNNSKKNSTSSSEDNKNTNASKNEHVSSTPINKEGNDEKSNKQIQNISEKKENICTSFSKLNLLNKLTNSNSSNSNTNNSKKSETCVQMTKGDLNKILKNIQSTKAIYESPKTKKTNDAVIDETLDDEIHPALLSDDSLIKKSNRLPATIIDETLSNSDIIKNQRTEINTVTSSKIHDQSVDSPKDNTVKTLSKRKKKEISNWLMTGLPRLDSDNSSFNNVPASNKNSISSGNSSLERLEMNYETPNNRGKIEFKRIDNYFTPLNTKSTPIVSHQFLEKPDPPVFSYVFQENDQYKNEDKKENDQYKNEDKKENDQYKNEDKKELNNMNVIQCTDILDKLYGQVWRDKADDLLSTPTEKQSIVMRKDRTVQKDRKATRNKHYSIKATDKQNTSSTNKKVRLINQKQSKYNTSSSENESECSYYTALTNLQASNIVSDKLNTISSSVQRPIEIYDSDTKDKCNTDCAVQKVLDKKISSFNNEKSSSDTSEFDPDDDITEKRIHKRENKFSYIHGIKQNSTRTTTNKNHFPYIESDKKETYSFLASLSDSVPLTIAHPDAKKYRQSYKKNKEELCKDLYKLYNENIFYKMLPEDMVIEWNIHMREVAGYCHNRSYINSHGRLYRTSRIELSTKVLDTPDRLRDTLIHEICHAACWIINGTSNGHGYLWITWANRAMKIFPELPPIRRFHDYNINTKFMYKCMQCGCSIGRHSKSLDIENKRCDYCNGKFELFIRKTTKSGTTLIQAPKREPNAFALYVKDNYNTVKKETNLNHAELMKLLGKKFLAIKMAKEDDNNTDDNNDKDIFDWMYIPYVKNSM